MLTFGRLDSNLSNRKNDIETNASLAVFCLGLFLFQQILELSILFDHGASYLDLCRFDCGWYASIMDHGYDQMPSEIRTVSDQRNLAFFPLLPLLAKVVKFLFLLDSNEIALVFTSKIFFLLSIFAFIKFTKEYFPNLSILTSGITVALNPYSIYANVGYTESPFLFLTCTCFYFAKRKKYLTCGTYGGLLSATRLVGICFAASYAISTLRKFLSEKFKQKIPIILGGFLTCLGLSLFMLFLHLNTEDFLAFININKAPGWGRNIGNPFQKLILGFNGNSYSIFLVSITTFSLLCSGFLAIKKNHELAIFSALCTLIPLSTGLFSIQRFVMFQAPILLVIALLIRKKVFLYSAIFCFICFIYETYDMWLLSNEAML